MTIKKLLLLLAVVLLLPCPARAQGASHTYVIKKGDTLWGISQRFIKDPYYWPNLWANNPYIGNPHLIYPGQKVAIHDGRLEIVPAKAPAPAAATAPAPAAKAPAAKPAAPAPAPAPTPPPPKPQESITIKTVGGSDGFVSLDELKGAGTLIDTVDNRLLIGPGEKVFLDMGKSAAAPKVGERFSLFEVGKEIRHPVTGDPVGYQMTDIGVVRVTAVAPKVTTAVVSRAYREVQRGDKVRPYRAPVTEISLKKAEHKLSGYVVSADNDKMIIGQYDVIYLDLGTDKGLQVGNLLDITRPRKASDLALDRNIQLPEELVGSAVVIQTRARTATALVLKVANPVFIGDRVTTVMP